MRTGPSFQLARAKRVLRPMCQVLVLALALSLLLTVVGGTEYLQCPNVFIIGAMKCGTTTLYQLLSDNPHVCSDGEKEVRARGADLEKEIASIIFQSSLPVADPNLPPHPTSETLLRQGQVRRRP